MPVPEGLWPNRPAVRHVGAPVSAGSRAVAVRETQKSPFLEPDHCGERQPSFATLPDLPDIQQ